MAKTLYFNIEDDVKTITSRLRLEPSSDFVLVFPRRSYLFADPVNVKLLKKQLEVLGKTAAILTMDERGQAAAQEAGFELKALPGRVVRSGMGDISTKKIHNSPNEVTEPFIEEEVKAQNEPEPERIAPRPRMHSIPTVGVHDTIFSNVAGKSTQESGALFSRVRRTARMRTVWVGSVALVILFCLIFVTVLLPKATIAVYPKTESVSRDLEISLSTAQKQPDVNVLSMPATAFEKTVEIEDTFQSVGKKELGSKSTGKVRVFNLTGASINLRASTTTLTAKGQTYTFSTDQNYIKPVSGKAVTSPSAGHLASVSATVGGEAGNIPAGSRLEISNQVFGSKPQQLYAIAEEDFVGGNSRFVSIVDQSDLASAQDSLVKKITDNLAQDFKKQSQLLAEKAFTVEVLSFVPTKQVGEESPSFSAKASVRVKGLVFDPTVLASLVRSRVTQVLSQGNHLEQPDKDSMSFKVRQIDQVAGTMRFIVHFESFASKDVDIAHINKDLTGASKTEASDKLAQNASIDHADIVLWPSWQTSLPRLASRISIQLVSK